MKKVLITGVSSGIGRELVKGLCLDGYLVVGIARRKDLLESLKEELPKQAKFKFIVADLSNKDAWEKIISILKTKKIIPDTAIFNAATWEKKLVEEYNYESLERMHQVNFLSVMKGLSLLFSYCGKRKTHFIAISTLSALWGSSVEGLGYPSSKAALTNAFEGLYQKFKNTNFSFTTVSFGPIKVDTNSFILLAPFQITLKGTVDIVKKAIIEKKAVYFTPSLTFFCFNLIRFFPTSLRLTTLALVDRLHPYNLHKK